MASWKPNLLPSRGLQSRPARRRTRPVTEQLEDRSLLSNYSAATAAALIADIKSANTAGGSNTITLTAPTTSPYVLTAVNNSTNGANGLPVIAANDNLTVVGNGDTIERRTASATPDFRLLNVAGGASLTLANLTLERGYAAGLANSADGGAIFNQGTLTLSAVTVQYNVAAGGSAAGGGIWSSGTLTLENTAMRNSAPVGGAVYIAAGTVNITGSTFTGNQGSSGGGLYIAGGAVTLTNDTVESNSASYGGGLYVAGGKVTLSSDKEDFNSASAYGGGLYIAGGTVTLADDTVEFNLANGSGGGLYVAAGTATLSNDTLESNSANGSPGYGGGAYFAGGTVTLADDMIQANVAATSAGGIYIARAATVSIDSSTMADLINSIAPTDPNTNENNDLLHVDPKSTPQETTVGTDFSYPLRAQVTDGQGNGVANQPVTFTINSDNGASGSFLRAGPPTTTALSFNGSSEYLEVPTSTSLQSPSLNSQATLEAWVYLNQLPSAAGHIMTIIGESEFRNDFDLQVGTDNRVYLFAGDVNPGSGNFVASNTVLQTGVVYWIAATYQAGDGSGVLQIYINGKLDAVRGGNFERATNPNPLTIGWDYVFPGRYLSGMIADPSIWGTVETQQQIENQMDHQLQGNESGLVGAWQFSEQTGTTAHDLTANHNNGALTDPSMWTAALPMNVTSVTVTTDASGWAVVGGNAGQPNFLADGTADIGSDYTVNATFSSQSLNFKLTNEINAALVLDPNSTSQETKVGTDFSHPLRARVIDAHGNGVANQSVTFTINSDNGASGSFLGVGPPTTDALSFNGTSEYVEVPTSPSLDSQALTTQATLEAWVYLNQLPSVAGHIMTIIGKSEFGNDLDMQIGTDNRVYLYAGDINPGSGNFVASQTILNTGAWYWIAATYRGGSNGSGLLQIYINGKLDASQAGTFARATNPNPLTLGWDYVFPGRYLSGLIADPSVWDVVVPQAQIQSQMTSQLQGNESGLVAAWQLSQQEGTIAYDLTANHNNGTLASASMWTSVLPGVTIVTVMTDASGWAVVGGDTGEPNFLANGIADPNSYYTVTVRFGDQSLNFKLTNEH
jgi:hypothetical protein